MPDYDELIHTSATIEKRELAKELIEKKSFRDYFSLAVTTFGVGYLPLMPGTYGSVIGVLIYLGFRQLEAFTISHFSLRGWQEAQISAVVHVVVAFLFLLFCLLGIWASGRATKLFRNKDPQQAVIDEIIGQLLVFLFVPFNISWVLIAAGFLLFRLFDIWKPYPIDSLQNLPAGIGVCADDILAAVYAGAILSLLYAVSLIL